MFSRIIKMTLVATSIAPIALVAAWVAFSERFYWTAFLLLATAGVLFLLCLLVLSQAKKQLEKFDFKPSTVEAADRESTVFMLLYLSPLFAAQFGSINWNVLVPTIAIFLLLTATGYSYHFNPLLGLLGWHFYKVTSSEGVTYVLVTKKQLRNTGQIGKVGQLTDYILMDLGEVDDG